MSQSIDNAYDIPEQPQFIKAPAAAVDDWGVPLHSRAAQVAIAADTRPKAPPGSLRAILDDRGNDYGDFTQMSRVAQGLKDLMKSGGAKMDDAKQEAVDMICTKLSRLACGNHDKIDTWADIAGYATLIADLLKKEKQA